MTPDEVVRLLARPTWMHDAACRGTHPSIFYPNAEDDAAYAGARVICRTCPVAMECADYGAQFGNNEGMWGGLSPRDQRRWRKMQRRARKTA